MSQYEQSVLFKKAGFFFFFLCLKADFFHLFADTGKRFLSTRKGDGKKISSVSFGAFSLSLFYIVVFSIKSLAVSYLKICQPLRQGGNRMEALNTENHQGLLWWLLDSIFQTVQEA